MGKTKSMFLPIEPIRKEIILYKEGKIETFEIKGRIRHLKLKFKEINF